MAELITADNFDELLDDLGELGVPRFHVFDLVAEARAAELMRRIESGRARGHADDSEIAILPDGEGVLMAINTDDAITNNGFKVSDWRTEGPGRPEVFGSWELPLADCEALLSAPHDEHRIAHARAVAAKVAEIPNPHVIQHAQIVLEQATGAYVGFLSISVADVRDTFGQTEPGLEDVPDAGIQSAIYAESQKFDPEEAFGVAMDAVWDRLVADFPTLAEDGEPEDDDGMEP
ncbi:hypothetical protein OM960_15600 [Defluviimonas sp. CAU 1641]|uniref:Uncharacterized protein n=2 Tax=Defluviimonas salinarum TaxID=2992147 RepID=A0ABT3J5L7_9RHOB|nr:hypothetical protein [Defluviimonas salinarum]